MRRLKPGQTGHKLRPRNSKIASQVLGVRLNGWPLSYFKTRNAYINQVTITDVQRAAQLLTPDRLLLVSVGGTKITLD